jgi:hypothetical protein
MSRLKPAEPAGLDPVRRLTRRTAQRMYGLGLQGQGFTEGMYCVAPEWAEPLGAEVGAR